MFQNAKYNYKHAVRLPHLITNKGAEIFDLETKPSRRGKQARSVFACFLKLMTERIVRNNECFVAPTEHKSFIGIQDKSIKEKRHIYKNITRKYKGVDLLNSNGMIYEMFIYNKSIPGRYRSVRINHALYQEMIELVNNGLRYTNHKKIDYSDLVEEVALMTKVDNSVVSRIIRMGVNSIETELIKGKRDIKISSVCGNKVSLTIFKKRKPDICKKK